METRFSLAAGLGPADTVGSPSVEGTLPATDLSLPRIVAVVDGGKRAVGVDTFTPVLGVDYIF